MIMKWMAWERVLHALFRKCNYYNFFFHLFYFIVYNFINVLTSFTTFFLFISFLYYFICVYHLFYTFPYYSILTKDTPTVFIIVSSAREGEQKKSTLPCGIWIEIRYTRSRLTWQVREWAESWRGAELKPAPAQWEQLNCRRICVNDLVNIKGFAPRSAWPPVALLSVCVCVSMFVSSPKLVQKCGGGWHKLCKLGMFPAI